VGIEWPAIELRTSARDEQAPLLSELSLGSDPLTSGHSRGLTP